jgi:hypothetical protein
LSTEPDGTQKPNTPYFFAAAHVQGIGEEGQSSGWIGAPDGVTVAEPTTLQLLGLALLLAAGRFVARKSAG